MGLGSLPAPDDAARSLSNELVRLIRDKIESGGGTIGFDQYMQLALYAPGLGYYTGGLHKLGETGDFVTAPEISSLFPRCAARQVAQILGLLGGGQVLEVGAGSGIFAGEMMRALLEADIEPCNYSILETSPDLRARQSARLKDGFGECFPFFRWIDDFPPKGFRGVVLANELLDALPVSRFCISADEAVEMAVGWDHDRFIWSSRYPAEALKHAIDQLLGSLSLSLPEGYTSEISLIRASWVREMLERIDAGVALLIDYGYRQAEYYHPQRAHGTLRCHYRHRSHEDPFVLAGLQDITTHVDFSAVARSARETGATVAGYTTQANFLLSTGLIESLATLTPGTRDHAVLSAQVKRLVLPGEMGDAVKVLALARDVDNSLIGFNERDLSGQL